LGEEALALIPQIAGGPLEFSNIGSADAYVNPAIGYLKFPKFVSMPGVVVILYWVTVSLLQLIVNLPLRDAPSLNIPEIEYRIVRASATDDVPNVIAIHIAEMK
jgi:hypothetical protein